MCKRLLFLLITSLFFSITSLGQDMKVRTMTHNVGDLSASTYERKDLNGTACALVKVLLPYPNVKFEGNIIPPVEYKTGEYWVYMSSGSQELRIKHPQAQPLHVIFSNYAINKVESKSTYNLSIQMPTILQTQKLTINYTPVTAMILVDSKLYKGNGRVEVTLPVGSHNYIIAAEGYSTAEGSIKLNSDSPRTITENLIAVASETGSSQSNQYESETKQESKTSNDPFEEFFSDPFGGFFGKNNKKGKDSAQNNLKDADINLLGIKVRPITDSQKKQLEINYGLEVLKVSGGPMKEAGVPKGLIIQKVNDKAMHTFDDLQNVTENSSMSKDKTLIIRGLYPTGKRAGFVIYIK